MRGLSNQTTPSTIMIKVQLTLVDAPCAEYFFHIAKLNQLLVLSQQLEEDIRHLGSHKYIAHQLSVIYVRRINHFSIMHQPLCFHSTISCVLFFCSKSFALSEEFRLSLK